MFSPNNVGQWRIRIGFTKNGDATFGPARSQPCSVVELNSQIAKTPIRATASASQAASDEEVSAATILFPAKATIALGDAFTIAGIALRVKSMQPRFDVFGTLDHHECQFEVWADAH